VTSGIPQYLSTRSLLSFLETLPVLIPLYFLCIPHRFSFLILAVFWWACHIGLSHFVLVTSNAYFTFIFLITIFLFFCSFFPLSVCYSNCGNLLRNITLDKAECIRSLIFYIILVKYARTFYVISSALEFFRLKTLSMTRKRKFTLHPNYILESHCHLNVDSSVVC
jgi:hypothetical protein